MRRVLIGAGFGYLTGVALGHVLFRIYCRDIRIDLDHLTD